MAGLVMECTSVTWVVWEGSVWGTGLVITKGMLLVVVWTHRTPMNVCTYKHMVLTGKKLEREEASLEDVGLGRSPLF